MISLSYCSITGQVQFLDRPYDNRRVYEGAVAGTEVTTVTACNLQLEGSAGTTRSHTGSAGPTVYCSA